LQLRPELCPQININDVAKEISGIPGVALIHVYDLPSYQAVSFRGYPGPELLHDQRFVDYNATSPVSNAEVDGTSGHAAQLKNTEIFSSNQTLPGGLLRTLQDKFVNNKFTGRNENNTGTNVTSTNASSLSASAGCEMHKAVPISTDTNRSASDANVDIAILDTGVSLTHPDLNVYRQVTFINGTSTANDDQGHGSHVAGIAAAKDNKIGIVGVAPGARIWAIKVCDGLGECKVTNQIKGIEYAIKHANEIDVLNISIENQNSPALNNIINAAVKAGITVAVAAGNYGKDASMTTPANNPNVLTVSAIADTDGKCGGLGPIAPPDFEKRTIPDDTFAYFSNFGPVVKIAAPGVNILSTYNGTGYAVDSGTSMAAPYVSGAAALYKAEHPNATPSEVMASILKSGSLQNTPCDSGAHGYFTGDLDKLPEPLLYGRQLVSPGTIPVVPKPTS
jgi:subtilisin family serine protease